MKKLLLFFVSAAVVIALVLGGIYWFGSPRVIAVSPPEGETVPAGVLIMGEDLTAVDATAARLMGIYPERISYLLMMQRHGGTVHEARISQLGEPIAAVRRDFRVLPYLTYLKQRPSLIKTLFLIN